MIYIKITATQNKNAYYAYYIPTYCAVNNSPSIRHVSSLENILVQNCQVKMFANRLQSLAGLSKTILKSSPLRFSSSITAARQNMEKLQVVPDVVPVAPTEVAKVTYVSGVSCDLGNELTPTQVKDAPKVDWNADTNSFYTLCLTDPDAPSRQEPTYREVSV